MPRISSGKRRQELLEAAQKLIFAEGMSRFTIRRLAERVQITEAAIYRHFPSKEELLLSLLAKVFATWQTTVPRILCSSADPAQRLLTLAKFHIDTMLEAHFNPLLLLSDASSPEQGNLRKALALQAQALFQAIQTLIQEGIDRQVFSPQLNAEIGAGLFLGAIQNAVVRWTLTGNPTGLATRLQHTHEYLLQTFQREPNPARPQPPMRATGSSLRRSPAKRSAARSR